MGLESATYVNDLNSANPTGSDDKAEGDNHLRLIKAALKATFPNATKPFRFPSILSKTANYTVAAADDNALIVADATGGAFAISFPAGLTAGFSVTIVKSDVSANAVTVDTADSATINGANTRSLATQYDVETYTFDGSNWVATVMPPAATTTIKGVAELATLAEVKALDATRITTAANIAGWLASALMPGGRLTLTTGEPVMPADVSGGTALYYTPYVSTYVPLWDNSASIWKLYEFAELTLNFSSNSGHTGYHQSGKNFDVFVFNDGGTIRLGTGPAWTDDTTRSAALAYKDGKLTNNTTMTLRFGSASGNTVSVAANEALYVGTMRASADGQCTWTPNPNAAAGGSNNKLYLWNMYHRRQVVAVQKDSNTSHTYTTATYRAFANSNSTRISFIAGRAEGNFVAQLTVLANPSSGNAEPGIGYDKTNDRDSAKAENADAGVNNQIYAIYSRRTELGHHYVQEVERAAASGTTTWYDSETQMFLTIEM